METFLRKGVGPKTEVEVCEGVSGSASIYRCEGRCTRTVIFSRDL